MISSHLIFLNYKILPDVIASDRRERGNLVYCSGLLRR